MPNHLVIHTVVAETSCDCFRMTGNSASRGPGPFPVMVKQAHNITLAVDYKDCLIRRVIIGWKDPIILTLRHESAPPLSAQVKNCPPEWCRISMTDTDAATRPRGRSIKSAVQIDRALGKIRTWHMELKMVSGGPSGWM